jgi:mannose-6-phosphate isomerase-like protein (cupin superfamily)
MKTKKNSKIITKDKNGIINGYLIPIFNVHDGFIQPEQHPQQTYLTVVKAKSEKGPHLHLKRWGLFTCIKGNVIIVTNVKGKKEENQSGECHDFQTIQVPAGTPTLLKNPYDEDAYVLNMPSPAWHIDDQDDHLVENFNQ